MRCKSTIERDFFGFKNFVRASFGRVHGNQIEVSVYGSGQIEFPDSEIADLCNSPANYEEGQNAFFGGIMSAALAVVGDLETSFPKLTQMEFSDIVSRAETQNVFYMTCILADFSLIMSLIVMLLTTHHLCLQ